jgi:CRP-like cAMP-binding protein
MPQGALGQLDLFADIDRSDLRLLAEMARFVSIRPGKQVFAQGDPALHLYILVEGQVAIRYRPFDGDPLTVSTIAPGGVFGWSAFLARMTYTSSAIGEQAGRALAVAGIDFRALCEEHPRTGILIVERLADVIAGRLTGTRQAILDMLNRGVAALPAA